MATSPIPASSAAPGLFAAMLLAFLPLHACGRDAELADLSARPDAGRESPRAIDGEDDEIVPLLDTRALRAFPSRYLGHLVDCQLRHVGPLRATPAADLRLRSLGLSHTRLVRCASGFVDLAFRPSSSALAAFVRPGQDVRARVLDTGLGRDGLPILDFVAQREGRDAAPDVDDPLFAPLEAGADFRPAAIADSDASLTCVVSWVGAPRPDPAAEHGREPRFHVPLSCHRATGDAWVELVVPRSQVERVLGLRRGAPLSVRVTSLSGGRGHYPRVEWAP